MKRSAITLFMLMLAFNAYSQQILINEYQSSNDTTLSDYDGDSPDWIELYSLLDSTINLQGWFLSDDSLDRYKWQFPAYLLGSEDFLLIFASDKDTVYPNGEIHTSFKLGKGEEPVVLSRPDSSLCDYSPVADLNTDWSYGRYPDAAGEWFFFNQPTPGAGNSAEPYADFAEPPQLSHQPGFYTADFYLELIAANPDDTIYFTLNGSVPTRQSHIYTEPILMTYRGSDPNNLSLIRTTLPGQGFHAWDPPSGVVDKFNTVRARVIKTGAYPSRIISASYIVDSAAFTKFHYPVISLITDSLNFFDDTIGIYKAGMGIDSTDWTTAHFAQKGRAWERPVHVELFEPEGNTALSQDAGVRIHGHYSTTANIKSLRLYARQEYEKGSFNYPFFTDLNQNRFKRIILRNAGQDYAWCYMRDAFMQSLVNDLGFDTQAFRLSEVYLNGEYWGIHYIRERYDKYYLEENYNLQKGSMDILEFDGAVVEGDAEHYHQMMDFIMNNDMSDSINYAYVKTLMDCENYINYAASNIYFRQSDWPYNNIKYWRKRTSQYEPDAPYGHDGRWRWFMYDTDYGFGRVGDYDYDMLYKVLYQQSGWSPRIIQNLVGNDSKPGNEQFRNEFINTLADLMNANFKVGRVLAGIDSIKSLLLPEIEEHMERWNGLKNLNTWNNRLNVMINFGINRAYYVRKHVVENFDMVTDTVNVTLMADQDMGTIRINKLHINQSTPGLDNPQEPYPWTGMYFAGVPVKLTAVPNPGFEFAGWQGIFGQDTLVADLQSDTTFTALFQPAAPVAEEILINEINYHSPGFADAGDWLEIHNTSHKSFSIDGWKLLDAAGQAYFISSEEMIHSGDYLVFCSDTAKFGAIHPGIRFHPGQISFDWSGDDVVQLFSASDVMIDSVAYQDSSPWPEAPAFDGSALELKNPGLDNSLAESWQSAYVTGGTPGRANSAAVSALRINEFMADNESTLQAHDGSFSDWIELYNPLNVPVDIAGLYLTDDADEFQKCQIPATHPDSTTLPPEGYLLLWADGNTDAGVLHLNFKLSAGGEFIGLGKGSAETSIDTITFGEQQADVSTGRMPDGANGSVSFEIPTPGSANGLNQYIALPAGWSAIGSYLKPYANNIEYLFRKELNHLIILAGEHGVFQPDAPNNSLTAWNEQDAFLVKTGQPFYVKIAGLEFAYEEVTLFPGWTLIPCLSNYEVDIAEIIGNKISDILMIKEVAGTRIFWPEHNIHTLQSLIPGKAYLILAGDECEIDFPRQ
ncbi:MAG: CotH kinase family protein [Bacteroidales bacterium]